MCGLFDYSTTAAEMKLTLGYRILCTNNQLFFGHEFRYSSLTNKNEQEDKNNTAFTARGAIANLPVFRKNKAWASYMHLYLGKIEKMKDFLNIVQNK